MTDFKGSILELKGNQATVMTDTCDFILIKRQPGMFVGQQITFRKSDIFNAPKNHIRYLALIASVFLLAFCSIFFYQFFIPSTIFAYIDVDINPSLELVVDKNAKVLDIKPLNEDAKALLKDLKLIDMPVKQAMGEVLKQSEKMEFIKPGQENEVLISSSVAANKNNKSEEKILNSILDEIASSTLVSGSGSIKLEFLKVESQDRSLAAENGMSMGRYVLYSRMKQANIDITIDAAKTARVSDMLSKARINDSGDPVPDGKQNNTSRDNFGTPNNKNEGSKKEKGNENVLGNTGKEPKISKNSLIEPNKNKNENVKNNDSNTSNIDIPKVIEDDPDGDDPVEDEADKDGAEDEASDNPDPAETGVKNESTGQPSAENRMNEPYNGPENDDEEDENTSTSQDSDDSEDTPENSTGQGRIPDTPDASEESDD